MSRSSAVQTLRLGVLTGAGFGLTETCLTYGTGSAYRTDAALFLSAGFTLWLGVAAALVALCSLANWMGAGTAWLRRLASVVLIAGPAVLLSVRGGFTPGGSIAHPWLPIAYWGYLSILAAGFLRPLWSVATEPLMAVVGFSRLSLVTQGAAGLAAAVKALVRMPQAPLSLVAAGAAFLVYALTLLIASSRELRNENAGRPTRLVLLSPILALLLSSLLAFELGRPQQRPLKVPALPGASATRAQPGVPSVLLVTLDTARRDHLSCYGYRHPTTPRLDAFAAGATLFENAYAPSPYTLASHASLFTGLLPSRHEAHPIPYDAPSANAGDSAEGDYPLAPGVPTLAEELRSLGYRTAGIAANSVYLSEWTGLSRGFDRYECRATERRYGYTPVLLSLAARVHRRLYERLSSDYEMRADEVSDAALEWLRGSPEPFFLFLNYIDAHDPYEPLPPFDRRFLPDRFERVNRTVARAIVSGRRAIREGEREYLVSQYDGELGFVDQELGRLLAFLSESGRLERTLVIITSDHGEFFGEHGLAGHDKALYEEVLQVPLVVHFPGQTSGRRWPHRINLRHIPGLVRGVVRGASGPEDVPELVAAGPEVVAEQWIRRWLRGLDPARYDSPALRAVRSGPWKLIQKATGQDELYDLGADPVEQDELLSAGPQRTGELREQMLATLPPVSPGRSTRTTPLNPEVLRRLRALGYVQ